MSNIFSRIIEILQVEKHGNESFLKIKLLLDKSVELYWHIDSETADNLVDIFQETKGHKYRLSYVQHWDQVKGENLSSITKTNKDSSKKVYFSSSDTFKEQLNEIKHLLDFQSIEKLSFLSFQLPEIPTEVHEEEPVVGEAFLEDVENESEVKVEINTSDVTEKEQPKPIAAEEEKIEIPQEAKKETKVKRPFPTKLVAILAITLFATVVLGFAGQHIFSINSSEKEDFANAEELKKKTSTNKGVVVVEEEKTVESEAIEQNSDEKANEELEDLNIPFFKLENVKNFDLPDGKVALTFDDGPSIYTKQIVDVLTEYEVGGTFFFIGLNVNKFPENVQYVHDNGLSIGSHSFNHVDVAKLSYDQQNEELTESFTLLESIIGEKITLFRPPFGSFSEQTINLMENQNRKAVLWDRDPKDWQGLSGNQIFQYVKNNSSSGTIVLMHESQAVVDALPKIIEYLQKQGLEIVSLK